jgi:hypothetical protein
MSSGEFLMALFTDATRFAFHEVPKKSFSVAAALSAAAGC